MSNANGNNDNRMKNQLEDKAKEISFVLEQPDIDLWKLRTLAISEGGLVNGK
jgi:hypothetical protein